MFVLCLLFWGLFVLDILIYKESTLVQEYSLLSAI